MEDHGTWTVSITTDTDPVQQGTAQFEVIVAKAQKEVVFEGDQYQVSAFFKFVSTEVISFRVEM